MTLQGGFKVETGEKWHMVPLVDEIDSGIEVMRWVGIFMEVVVEEDERLGDWVFQRNERERMEIQDLDN